MLAAHADEVNALNVFPVPDGDTGSNMLATVRAAVDEAEELPETERTVPKVAAALRFGALMGARGNSGVILSQIFQGMSGVVTELERIDGRDLALAFEKGCEAAFAAVAHPVEGTILTVARDVATAAEPVARARGGIEEVLAVSAEAASASVERTPQLLAVLANAGVVDAGGKGLELMLKGALAFARGEDIAKLDGPVHDVALPALDAIEADGFGYETVFLITPHEGTRLETAAIRTRLDALGESVLVAGDARAVKIHVHNERPDEIISYGLSLGTLSRIGVENLDRQARGHANGSRQPSPLSLPTVRRSRRPVSMSSRSRQVMVLLASFAPSAQMRSSKAARAPIHRRASWPRRSPRRARSRSSSCPTTQTFGWPPARQPTCRRA